MNFIPPDLKNFIQNTWHYGAGTALCTFGILDCVQAYREDKLHLAAKVAYVARGVFFMVAGVLSLSHHCSTLPFTAAHIIGVGINSYHFVIDPATQLSSALGIISSVGYIVFSCRAHPAIFAAAFLTGTINILLKGYSQIF